MEDELLEELKRQYIRATAFASAARVAYHDLLVKRYWRQIRKIAGSEREPECILAYDDDEQRIKIVDVKSTQYDIVIIRYHHLNKNGKWSKDIYQIDINNVIDIIKPIPK